MGLGRRESVEFVLPRLRRRCCAEDKPGAGEDEVAVHAQKRQGIREYTRAYQGHNEPVTALGLTRRRWHGVRKCGKMKLG